MFRHAQPYILFRIEADIGAVEAENLGMGVGRKGHVHGIQMGDEADARGILHGSGQDGGHDGVFVDMDLHKAQTFEFIRDHTGQFELPRRTGNMVCAAVALGIDGDIAKETIHQHTFIITVHTRTPANQRTGG